MNANIIQSLLALNAAKISQKHAMSAYFTERAREWRFAGEEAYKVDAFKQASKYRSQLAKLHETQRVLHAELKAIYCNNRIVAKKAKLIALGLEVPQLFALLSSQQQEAELDFMIGVALRKAA